MGVAQKIIPSQSKLDLIYEIRSHFSPQKNQICYISKWFFRYNLVFEMDGFFLLTRGGRNGRQD